MAYLDVLNAVARVAGGTQPTAAQSSAPAAQQPYWFSGRDSGDGSGVAGLTGCWSLPTDPIDTTPVGMVMPGPWRPDEAFPTQGHTFSEDQVHLRVLTGHDTLQTGLSRLVNFRDSVPPAFNTHMQLFNTPGVAAAWCADGDFMEISWAGNVYWAMVFVIRVQRSISVTYTG